MLQWIRRRASAGRRARELYGSVVTAARQPVFYERLRVPDTPEGRFELISLHLFLALESLGQQDGAGDVKQRMIEAFVTDMDDCMREMGVGDLSVPKKVRRAAAAFYERASQYRHGLAGGRDPALEESLARYVFSGSPLSQDSVAELARYVRQAASALSDHEFDAYVSGGELERLLRSDEVRVP
jgi:cytochrome b pre-mRNA-processing protein 3